MKKTFVPSEIQVIFLDTKDIMISSKIPIDEEENDGAWM